MSAYFVTASGTGVGKTFTTCALLYAARNAGRQARGLKPIISGWNENEPSDTSEIIRAGGGVQTIDEVSPWRFHAPLSPHRAAVHEGKEMDLSQLIEWSHAQVAKPGLTLIEGVGGAMVPLTNRATVCDWMKALTLPVILVTGSYLGSISHTLTAIEVIRSVGLKIHAIVVNESADSSVDFAEAQAGLAPFIGNIPLQIFEPRVSSWQEAKHTHTLVQQL
jgi:dethiobiotin synthetase